MINSMARSVITAKKWYRSMLAGNPQYTDYELIATVLVGSGGAATVTFDVTSLTSSYKHLQIRAVARNNTTGSGVNNVDVRFNGDTGTNYHRHIVYGYGATMYSYNATGLTVAHGGWVNQEETNRNIFAVAICDIPDAFSTIKTKVLRTFTGSNSTGNQLIGLGGSFWNNTAAITSITLTESTSVNFGSGSRFSLYGIKG